MTETIAPETLVEQLARINQMVADANLAMLDAEKRKQDIQFAPWVLVASGAGAAAALMAATATLLTILYKWLQH